MLQLELDDELEASLNRMAQETAKTPSQCALEALRVFLEDREDYLMAVEAANEGGPTYSLEEVKRSLGLDS